jgi:hypothetical protein
MKRRTEERRAEAAAVAEVEERERAAKAEQDFKDSARSTIGPRLLEWSQETSGRKVRSIACVVVYWGRGGRGEGGAPSPLR